MVVCRKLKLGEGKDFIRSNHYLTFLSISLSQRPRQFVVRKPAAESATEAGGLVGEVDGDREEPRSVLPDNILIICFYILAR